MRCVQFGGAASEAMPSYTASQHTSTNITPSILNSISHSPGVLAVVCPKTEEAPPTPEHFMRHGDCMTMLVEREPPNMCPLLLSLRALPEQ